MQSLVFQMPSPLVEIFQNPHKLMDKKKSLQMKGTDLEDCHLNIQNICNFQYSEFYLKFHLHVCLSCQKLLKEIFL